MVKDVVETTAKVLRSKEVPFEVDQVRGRPVVRATKLGKAFFRCAKVDTGEIARQFPRHRFSPFYLAFDKYCEGLWCGEDKIDPYMAEALNDAIANIRAYGKVGGLRKQLDNLRRSERSNARNGRELLAKLRQSCSKVLAIRLDAGYYSEFASADAFQGQAITFDEAQAHRDEFLSYLRTGPLSEHLVGYMWKMEFGIEKGYHFHMAIFFNGQKLSSDIRIASILGNHWKTEVTRGKGMYFNCNQKKESYVDRCIGMLTRGDDSMWAALGEHVRYMTKVDHYIRFQAPRKCRTFGIGGPYLRSS